MSEKPDWNLTVEDIWRLYLVEGEAPEERRRRRVFKYLPGNPRCRNCYAPFKGPGSVLCRAIYGKVPSSLNPQLCNVCEQFARDHQGGVELELTMLFADVRGSTTLAERMSPTEYSGLINRFYRTATQIMVRSDALIDKIIGDQVAGMFVPGVAGPDHARRAVEAAQAISRSTGHGDPAGPWIPLGVGVHTGIAFVGSMGSEEGTSDITVLGDAANVAARLSSSANLGEILISEATFEAARIELGPLEERILQLKGKTQPVSVHVLKTGVTRSA